MLVLTTCQGAVVERLTWANLLPAAHDVDLATSESMANSGQQLVAATATRVRFYVFANVPAGRQLRQAEAYALSDHSGMRFGLGSAFHPGAVLAHLSRQIQQRRVLILEHRTLACAGWCLRCEPHTLATRGLSFGYFLLVLKQEVFLLLRYSGRPCIFRCA